MGKTSPQVLCQFGINFLLGQSQRLVDELPGVQLGRDIEAIHRMRVASRRLATGLDVFKSCLPKKKSGLWRGEIRKVTSALGNARDLDIQIAQLTDLYGEKLEATYKPGYNRLLLRLKQSRSKAQKKVNKTVFKLNESQALDQMMLWLEKHLELEMLSESHSPALYHKAYQSIAVALEAFLMHSDFIASEADSDKLHAMRIAAKRLRYTMEIFAPIYGDDLKPFMIAMKDIQDTLGEFHDADVWVSWLPKFVDQEKLRIEDYFGNTGPLERLMPGIHHLMALNEQTRADAYQSFLMIWQTMADDNAWRILHDIIEPPPLPLEEDIREVDSLSTTDELPVWIKVENDDAPAEVPAEDESPTEEVMTVEELEITWDENPTQPQADPLPDDKEPGEARFIDLTDDFPTEE